MESSDVEQSGQFVVLPPLPLGVAHWTHPSELPVGAVDMVVADPLMVVMEFGAMQDEQVALWHLGQLPQVSQASVLASLVTALLPSYGGVSATDETSAASAAAATCT